MARDLISKRGQLDSAPDCRTVAEFAAKMKPDPPDVSEQSSRAHIAGTTMEVTAPAPESRSSAEAPASVASVANFLADNAVCLIN